MNKRQNFIVVASSGESSQYIFVDLSLCSLYNKMVILFDTLLILLLAAVLENCLETPGLKPFRTSCAKLRFL